MRFVHPIGRYLSPTCIFLNTVALDQYKVWQNVTSVLDPNYLKLHGGIQERFNLKVDFKTIKLVNKHKAIPVQTISELEDSFVLIY